MDLRSAGSRRIGGYAAVFGVKSEPLGGFVEQVDRRAFNKSTADGWPGVLARFVGASRDASQTLGGNETNPSTGKMPTSRSQGRGSG
ncbi:MAG: HK97 family phage prohead protease [Mycobacterium sp.]